ncbi:rhodanese-like domain-containing protein [Dyadobacter sp. CY326]|uniref:rhodanese-like domain-containing protein n=1 Tax=Dyadobacter sp. CY326 TaxID=2907300 RepID=UPI001F3FE4FA|nr:rhodanese-like domain-containing protein [Dyadobacter sp. CY326]MCE7066792.1 rhodanese-like domain-containing protein [Dyadobacter sp. CY326]
MTRNNFADITLQEARHLVNKPDAILVDVRENWEFEEFNEGGINIPLADIRARRTDLAPYNIIVVICTNGVRSKVAAMDYCRVPEWLDKQIFHVHGGIIESE